MPFQFPVAMSFRLRLSSTMVSLPFQHLEAFSCPIFGSLSLSSTGSSANSSLSPLKFQVKKDLPPFLPCGCVSVCSKCLPTCKDAQYFRRGQSKCLTRKCSIKTGRAPPETLPREPSSLLLPSEYCHIEAWFPTLWATSTQP